MLLPTNHSICGSIQTPKWHSIEMGINNKCINDDYKLMLYAIGDIAINLAVNTNSWKNIINKADLFFYINENWPTIMLENCRMMSEDNKMEIADLLRVEISRNREFPDSEWAISEENISKMEEVFKEIEPDGIKKYIYLFGTSPALLHPIPYDREDIGFEEQRNNLINIRTKVAYEILNKYGSDVLIDFSLYAEATGELAQIIVKEIFCSKYNFDLLGEFRQKNHQLYASILCELYRVNGIEELLNALNHSAISNEEKADILSYGTFNIKVWDRLNELDEDIVKYYWEHVEVFRLYGEDEKYNDYLFTQLIKFNRPFSAVRNIAFSEYKNSEIIMDVLDKCCKLQNHIESNGMSLKTLSEHDILDLFNKLYCDCNINSDHLIQLEISFLTVFKFDSKPKGIMSFLQENPTEYVKLITYNNKSDNAAFGQVSKRSIEQRRLAFRIVDLFTTVPGCNKEVISKEKFENWIITAYDYANQIGYKQSLDYCLGRLLSYVPNGNDGIFPHEFVRRFLERYQSEKLTHGFVNGKISQRGAYFVSSGNNEKEIARKFHEDASDIRIDYPHTAAILDEIADFYQRQSVYDQKSDLLDFNV